MVQSTGVTWPSHPVVEFTSLGSVVVTPNPPILPGREWIAPGGNRRAGSNPARATRVSGVKAARCAVTAQDVVRFHGNP